MDKFAAMRVFVKIADAGNLSAASRQLGLSLTSVSRQLMALEEVLGTTLVERTTRHLSLTESGLLYYERAKQRGGRRGGTRPDDADGGRGRPVACERSIAARSVAVGANAARLSAPREPSFANNTPGEIFGSKLFSESPMSPAKVNVWVSAGGLSGASSHFRYGAAVVSYL
jgi:DNA-binding transcriptional LysR family regulator